MKKRKDAYIYGAGKYALSEFYRIALSYNILGFIVSKKNCDLEYLMNLPVLEIEKIEDKDSLIIICSSFSMEISETLESYGFNNFLEVKKLIKTRNGRMIFESESIKKNNKLIDKIINLTDIKKSISLDGIIVSLTSFPDRFRNLDIVIKSLKKQTYLPEKIVLWVSHNDFKQLPEKLINLQDTLFEICQCEDLKSYKKLIPSLEKYPDKTIVTADDDNYYWPTWLQGLVDVHNKYPKAIVAHRIHRINPLKIDSYQDWQLASTCKESQEVSSWNFPTGVTGILYPCGCFHSEVLNRELFMKLCPEADDIWFYWMYRMNDFAAIGTGIEDPQIAIDDDSSTSLYETNVLSGGNDRQLKNMIEKYGFREN